MKRAAEILTDRQTVRAALEAYRRIEEDIQNKLQFAKEAEEEAEKYASEAEELRTVKREIIRCLNGLPSAERNALYYHYIQGRTWAWVSVKCAYSERQIRNIANRGLDRLSRTFAEVPVMASFCSRIQGRPTL